MGVRIDAFEIFAVDLPFRRNFRHAAAERSTSESLFVKCVTDTGCVGFGESLPRAYVTGESRDGAFALLLEAILPRLLGRSFDSLDAVENFLRDCDGRAPADWVSPQTPQAAAWAAVDLALLDVFGRAFGVQPLRRAQHDLPTTFRYSGVAGAGGGMGAAVSLLRQRLYGLCEIKLKLDAEEPEAVARTARRLLGTGVDLRADANMAWTCDQALTHMRALSQFGVSMFEQPIAAEDLSGMARLVAESGLGVMADESFASRESLAELIASRACTAVNARISKCGGLVATLARCCEARAAGLEVQVGCQVGESSLLSAAQLILCSVFAPVLHAEGCFGLHLLREDPASPVLSFSHGGRPPARPCAAGLGVTVDERVLRRFATRRERLTKPATAASPMMAHTA